MRYFNHVIHRGQWNCNQKHGAGLVRWPDGSLFEGFFKDDMAEGSGKLWLSNTEHQTIGSTKLYEEYWISGVTIRISATHVLPPLPEPERIIPGDIVSTLFFLFVDHSRPLHYLTIKIYFWMHY
eukprot:TRINITY_DN4428_c0_g1_i6.p1 TRINITY_DN4428_c0_g1~~TRINITY_DN4428_c0_g1_i6.p1  ORF type:complete len:124 (-),score=9.49 TRINITY_DN4428_c0_g1_i6:204-575(-)